MADHVCDQDQVSLLLGDVTEVELCDLVQGTLDGLGFVEAIGIRDVRDRGTQHGFTASSRRRIVGVLEQPIAVTMITEELEGDGRLGGHRPDGTMDVPGRLANGFGDAAVGARVVDDSDVDLVHFLGRLGDTVPSSSRPTWPGSGLLRPRSSWPTR